MVCLSGNKISVDNEGQFWSNYADKLYVMWFCKNQWFGQFVLIFNCTESPRFAVNISDSFKDGP